jgi:hypothetical protein
LIDHKKIVEALSLERFSRYVAGAGGSEEQALALYALNMRLSEALYTPLQMLEICIRNRIHTVMSEKRHERWFEGPGLLLLAHQKDQLATARRELAAAGKEETSGRIVAALTFSFWTAMFSPIYQDLWQSTLNRVARREDGKGLKRQELAGPLAPIRVLRNRIAHHEPVLNWDLAKHHAKMIELTRWLAPAAAAWCAEHDRFHDVFPANGILLAGSTKA